MKPLFVPYTKLNPAPGKMALSDWRSKEAQKKSQEARRTLKKPTPRVLERIK